MVPEPRFLTAISTIFCVSGAALANWFPRIPATRAKLDLTYDELGLALFCVGGGAMVSMLITGALIFVKPFTFIDALGNIRGLAIDAGNDRTGLIVKSHP